MSVKGREKTICKGFAGRLSAAILEKGIKQAALSKLLGLNRHAVARYTSGRSEPDLHAVVIMAEALNVSCDWLMRGSGGELANSRVDDLISRVTRIEQELFSQL